MGQANPIIKNLAYWAGRFLPDKIYLSLRYRVAFHKALNWKNPQTFNEKLQWIKLYDRNPFYTLLVDKYEVRKYVESIIGKEHLIPLLGVWDNFEDIDFESLPNQFVLKCTHDSKSVLICKDKSIFDIAAAHRHFKKRLKRSSFWGGREWPYKNVPRRIIAEKYMVDESGTGLKDYKFFCFDGEPKLFFIASDRNRDDTDVKFDFFDIEFNHLPIRHGHDWTNQKLKKPHGFEKMIEIARLLSKGIPHVRVDLYNINGEVYFGELTFSHHCGFVPFEPEEWDYKLGSWLVLPPKKKT